MVCLRLDKPGNPLSGRLRDWKNEAEKLRREEIYKEEYDAWRHSYPRLEVERQKQHRDELHQKRKETKPE